MADIENEEEGLAHFGCLISLQLQQSLTKIEKMQFSDAIFSRWNKMEGVIVPSCFFLKLKI